MTIRIRPPSPPIPADGGGPAIPTSKSHAQRALCLQAFAPRPTALRSLPAARDVTVLRTALRSWQTDPDGPLDLLDNGTGMRVLSVLLPMIGGGCVLDGTPRLRERPLTASEAFLRRYGGQAGTGWPRAFSAADVRWPEEVVVDARLTTQVATGVLLGAGLLCARAADDAAATWTGPRRVRIEAPSAGGYLAVTLSVLRAFGIRTRKSVDGADWTIDLLGYEPNEAVSSWTIPPDPSSFTFFAGLVAAHGHPVPEPATTTLEDAHPDWAGLDDLRQLTAGNRQQPVTIEDLGSRPDTFPCLAALAALRAGPTTLRGAPSLRHKESDRIAAMARVLRHVGAVCEELPDGLRIGGPMPLASAEAVAVPTPDDHRIVMAAAILGTCRDGGVVLEHPEAVAKSWPGFFEWLRGLGCVGEGSVGG